MRRLTTPTALIVATLGFATLGVAILGLGGPAMAIEQPKYVVTTRAVTADGDVELRHYAAYLVAEVVVTGDQGEAVRKGFRKLAGYIFGGNAGNTKIAMTAPVAQSPDGETIPMTRPVSQTPDGRGDWTVQFMMPAAYTLGTLPKPNDPDVRFRQVPAREMAVLSFSGVARDQDYRDRTAALNRWMAGQGLKARGPATLAQYDPPWTLWFLRRNEVLQEVAR